MFRYANRIQLENDFNRLCDAADAVFQRFDPCQIRDGHCVGSENFCCNECRHLGPDGCTTKALACKLWFCLRSDAPEAFLRAIEPLHQEARDKGLYLFRGTVEDVIARNHKYLLPNKGWDYLLARRFGLRTRHA